MKMSYLSDGHCVYETVSQRSPSGSWPLNLECLKVESDLTDAGADGRDGVGVGGRGGGGPWVSRAPDVGVVVGHLGV